MSENKNSISRRKFLQIGGQFLGTLLLPKIDIKKPDMDKRGPVIGTYSEPILQNRLFSYEPDETESHDEVINSAVNYLKNFSKLLEKSPEINTPITEHFSLIGFPISVEDNWKISDVINSFTSEVDSGKTKIEIAEPDQSYTLGTINKVENGNRTTVIMVNPNIFERGNFEDDMCTYHFFTNTELAHLFIHEHVHALQADRIMKDAENQGISYKQNSQNVKDNMRSSFPYIQVNEAQANAIHYLSLTLLNELNNGTHFPGTQALDPTGNHLLNMQKLVKGFLNLRTIFNKTVLQSHKIIDPAWLATCKIN